MALIDCPECGREVSDSAVQCPHCGFGVKEYVVREREIARIHDESVQEAVAYVKEQMRLKKERELREKREEEEKRRQLYQKAIKLFSSSSSGAEDAKKIFEELGDYEESVLYFNRCDAQIMTLKAEEEEANKKRIAEEARIAAENAEKKRKTTKIISIVLLSAILLSAVVFAVIKMVNIHQQKTCYTQAQEKFEQKDFSGAEALFSQLGDYQDSIDKLESCYFEEGKQQLENGNLEKAESFWGKISNDDLKNKAGLLMLEYADQKQADKDYYDAIQGYEKAGLIDPSISEESQNKTDETNQLLLEQALEEGLTYSRKRAYSNDSDWYYNDTLIIKSGGTIIDLGYTLWDPNSKFEGGRITGHHGISEYDVVEMNRYIIEYDHKKNEIHVESNSGNTVITIIITLNEAEIVVEKGSNDIRGFGGTYSRVN